MRIRLPPPYQLRALCIATFVGVLVQLFFLDEPEILMRISNATSDKVLHALAFGAFAMVLWFGIGFRAPILNWITITGVGALDEFHQIFIPTRSAEILDVVADSIGAAVVTLILHRMSAPSRGRRVRIEIAPQPGD